MELPDDVGETLRAYLSGRQMLNKVASEARVTSVRYVDVIFEPKPYSEDMPRGVPADLETYLDSESHVVVNVPPLVMFKAKCFKPSKLCAVYELLGGKRPSDVTYSQPTTAVGGAIGLADFDFGSEDEFADQLV